jgi:hypothetical protein
VIFVGNVIFQGRFKQAVYADIREEEGKIIPFATPMHEGNGFYGYGVDHYSAFERDDLIPSLVRLVKKVERNGNQNHECKKWIKRYGFLTVPNSMTDGTAGQSLEEFWNATLTIVNLWRMYTQAVNRNAEALKSYMKITFRPISDSEKEWMWGIPGDGFIWGKGNDCQATVESRVKGFRCAPFGFLLRDIEEDDLAPYQFAVLHPVAERVTHNIGRPYFRYENLSKVTGSDTDAFTIMASVNPSTLLQALYFQFLQLLTEKRKVCPSCWKSFAPKRNNQKFCNDGCRSTYHTRERRAKNEGVL